MPLHRFRCCNHHVTEILVNLEHDKWQPCGSCEMMAYQIPSAFRMPCAKRETVYGVEVPVADGIDPWKGTPLEGGGSPSLKDQLTKGSSRIQLDLGSRGPSRPRRGLSEADKVVVA